MNENVLFPLIVLAAIAGFSTLAWKLQPKNVVRYWWPLIGLNLFAIAILAAVFWRSFGEFQKNGQSVGPMVATGGLAVLLIFYLVFFQLSLRIQFTETGFSYRDMRWRTTAYRYEDIGEYSTRLGTRTGRTFFLTMKDGSRMAVPNNVYNGGLFLQQVQRVKGAGR